MDRADHLQWCKDRALEYVAHGDLPNALASMFSDLGKHPDTADHAGIQLGFMQQMSGSLNTPDTVRRFIQGFN